MRRQILCAAVVAASLALCASQALAAARTFVASTGNDANPCSVSAPCRTFGAALAATAVGGEVLVLDSAGYGAVNITQAASIIAPSGVYAGISVSSGQGVVVNAAGANVVLRGLTITGVGGTDGIIVQSAARVYIDNCVVSGMSNDGIKITGPTDVSIIDGATRENAYAGVEIDGADVTVERLHIHKSIAGVRISGNTNVTIHDSVVSGNSTGVEINYGSAPADSRTVVAISESVIERNAGYGVYASAGSYGNATDVSVVRSSITRNGYGLYVEAFSNALKGVLSSTDNDVSLNTLAGLRAGTYATLIASRNTVTRNLVGLWVDFNGHFLTRGDNTVEKNDTDLHLDDPLTPISGK